MTTPIKGCDLDSHLTSTLIEALQARDIVAAGRYTKNITAAEIALVKQMNFGLWFIHEGFGNLATFEGGETAGEADGTTAAQVLYELGIPPATVIFSAVDFPATASQAAIVAGYETGFTAGIAPHPPGLYADGAVLETLTTDTKTYVPGATSWPGTKDYLAEGNAALIQHATVTIAGVEVDLVDICDLSVVWWPQGQPGALHTLSDILALNPKFTPAAYNSLPESANFDFYRAEQDGNPVVCRRYWRPNGPPAVYTWPWQQP